MKNRSTDMKSSNALINISSNLPPNINIIPKSERNEAYKGVSYMRRVFKRAYDP